MTDVTLTAALRSNLLSLQGTQRLLDTTQLRLATGLKVNSALDNPSSFFAAQALNNRGSDLSNLLDGTGQAIQTLKAADEGIKAITSFLQQAKAIAQSAADKFAAGDTAGATALQGSFDAIRTQIDTLAADAGYRGTALLSATTVSLVVKFNEAGTSSLTINGVDLTTAGTGLNIAASDFTTSAATIQASITAIDTALSTVRTDAAAFGNNLSVIQTRQDYTQNLINVLKEGADKLTIADKNEEGAKLLSLQTSQQLGITSLSLASQANQSILRLFQ